MEELWSVCLVFLILFSTTNSVSGGMRVAVPYFTTVNFHVNGPSFVISCEHKDGVTVSQLDTATMVSVVSYRYETDKAVRLYYVNNDSKQTVLDYTLTAGVSATVDNLTLDFVLNGTLQMYWSQPSNMKCRCDANESCVINFKVSFDEDANGLQHIADGPYFELTHVSKFNALYVQVFVFQRCVPAATLSTSNDAVSPPQSKKIFLFITVLSVVVCTLYYKIWIRFIKVCWLTCCRLVYHFIMKKRTCCRLVYHFMKRTCCRLVYRFIMKKRIVARPLLPELDTNGDPHAFSELVIPVAHDYFKEDI